MGIGIVDIHVSSAKELDAVYGALEVAATDCTVKVANLDSLLSSDASLMKSAPLKDTSDNVFFRDYQNYANIVAKLEEWADAYPTLITYIPSIGKSVEGRDIAGIKITDSSFGGVKKAIFWNGGQHAREWASPSTVMYITMKLLVSTDASVQEWLQSGEIYVIPVQNPDGYEFTRSKRLWRKNRSKNKDGSFGVDLNRNWDDGHWGQFGASSNTGSETYKGPSAFSEPETSALANFMMSKANRVAGIDFHSYSQLILRNWGWTSKDSKNEKVLKELGDGMSAAIYKNSKVSYTSEKGASLYPASGCEDDWMSYKAGLVAYTIELRDTGDYGFVLPAAQIVPMGEEIWAAMNVFVPFVLARNISQNQ